MPSINRFAALAIGLATSVAALPLHAAPDKRPNFLVIVADDLGFSDLGAFGGEIATPNLDALALSGLRLTGWHTAPTCSPTRSMLLSGTDNHRAGLGTMAELIALNQKGKPGHEGYLSPNVATLAELLAANGYRTLQSGKWHLGLTPEQDPTARGFQHSFVMLQGAHNHFGTDLTTDPTKPGATYREDGRTLSALPTNFYSSDTFATKLIDQLRTTADVAEGKKPFFAYLTFTAPHWPLQAPQSDIAKYKGRYDAGFEALRTQRLKRQAELGLIDPTRPAHEPNYKARWASLNPAQQQAAARDMEVYAAMVDRLDQNVGRVIAELKAQGVYDSTVILFTADNGAEGMDLETSQLKAIKERVAVSDNSVVNRGNASSYIAYGPGWAQAATAPSWVYKAYATEGGTRAAAFIHYPGAQRAAGMQREFSRTASVRVPADQAIYDPTAPDARPLVGRVLARGLADEHADRHYLIVDGVDGRSHYVAIGKPVLSFAEGSTETDPSLPHGAIVRIDPVRPTVREVDRTIATVAGANGGRYDVDTHLRHDPTATLAFAETHVRRLEAMRRISGIVEREPSGRWIIAPDHFDRVAVYETERLRDRPVAITMLSAQPLNRLVDAEAATWIDRELFSVAPVSIRDAGFGHDLRDAQARRRQWLVAQGFAKETGSGMTFPNGMIAALQRRELLRVAGQLADEVNMPFREATEGSRIEGVYRRSVDLVSGRFALVERSRDFTLVPWRPVLEQQVGNSVSGLMRGDGINWSIGRGRNGPSIS